jgi:ArsR family transcriptional regulator, zinc-responsive transcriptional repressor
MNKKPQEPYKIFFETLGNKTRWDIVHLLKKKTHRVTEISEKLGYEQSLVSHHLKRLETCGFVNFKQNGNERVYTLNKETVGPLLSLMDKHINQFCKHCTGK